MPLIQLWDYGITVDPVPKLYSDGKSLHGIFSYHDEVSIPFQMKGSTSYFSSRLPTEEEKRSSRWVTFTSDKEWDPTSEKFNQAEATTRSHYGMKALDHQHFDNDGNELDGRKLCRIQVPRSSTVSEHVHDDVDAALLTFDHALDVALIARRTINDVSTNIHHTHQRIKVDDVTLGRRWVVSAEVAERTRKVTTQRGLRFRGFGL